MFIGEAGCWLVVGAMAVYRKYCSKPTPNANGYRPLDTAEPTDGESESAPTHGNGPVKAVSEDALSGARVLLLSLPAICDICGTTLMNAGLLMVAASIYQMTRGALVLFVGLFSVVFLRRRLYAYQWLSLVGVMLGVAIVGLAGAIDPDTKAKATSATDLAKRVIEAAVTKDDEALPEAARAIIGVLLIAGAQIFTATQFVLEEWILERSTIEPINVVGWEGLFGFIVTLIAMIVLHFAVGRTEAGRLGMFDMSEGFRQMTQNRAVLVSSFLIMLSIG